ncbi:MAG TPA: hypothetical protein VL486_11375 [Verrucomicrobiae bacterium]|nr:hypothetical protein [Verrucomicrobiae bacterium]
MFKLKTLSLACGIVNFLAGAHLLWANIMGDRLHHEHSGPLGAFMGYLVYFGPVFLVGLGCAIAAKQKKAVLLNLLYLLPIAIQMMFD